MQERVKMFTFVTGHGEALIEPHEDHINQWLSITKARLVNLSQSEGPRPGGGHHVTICAWHVPEEQLTRTPPSP